MSEIKILLGLIAIAMTFVAYVPYVKDVLKGKTTPHMYSWFLWSFLGYIVFALQFQEGAGSSAFVTLSAGIMATVVFVLELRIKRKKDITSSDTVFLLLSFCSLLIWLVAKQPVLSAILATITDLLIFAPTIRKTWNNPHSETVSFYTINAVRFLLATLALEHFTIVTALYPISWCLANGAFAVMLKVRRSKLVHKNQNT